MKKNIKSISEAISFLSDHFFYILYITLPVMLLLALCLTFLPPLAILPFLFLQGIMFRLMRVKRAGYEVRAQRMKSVYKTGAKNMAFAFSPRTLLKAFRYYYQNFKVYFSLTICCLFFYGFIAFMLSVPQIAILVIRNTIDTSRQLGDEVLLPAHLNWMFVGCLFVVNYLLSIVLADCLLPFPLRHVELRKEEAELQTIIPQSKN